MTVQLVEEFDLQSDVLAVKCNITHLLATISDIVPTSEQAYKSITGIYAQAKRWQKIIEEHRKDATAEARSVVNAINDKAKEFSEPLGRICEIANQKTAHYLAAVERQRKAEEAKINEAGAILGLEATVHLPQVAPARGDGAMAYTRVVKKFRLVDIAKVPLKYLTLNEDLIERDLELGICEIPGVEVYEETKTILRTR
jgi:hypothetical protein